MIDFEDLVNLVSETVLVDAYSMKVLLGMTWSILLSIANPQNVKLSQLVYVFLM